MTTITVLMPCLNPGQYLDQAIASALEQPELTQLVIADGGSDAETLERLERWQSRDARIEWLSEPDNGPADAFNKALARAKGEWVGWLNADDVYEPGALGRALNEIRRSPDLLMIYGHGQHIDSAGHFIEIYPSKPPEIGIERFQGGCFICQPTTLLCKKLIENIGGLNPKYKYAFDLDLWLRVFSTAPRQIKFIDAVQASTRLHEDTITSKHQWRINLECAQLLKSTLGKADQHWIETAAATYVGNQSSDSRENWVWNELSELGLDNEIQEKFKANCRNLYIEQENEKNNTPIRSDLPEALQLMLRSRPDLLRLQYDKPEHERIFCQWLIANGTREYSQLFGTSQTLSKLFDWLVNSRKGDKLPRLSRAIWDNNQEHQEKWKGRNKTTGYQDWLRKNWQTLGLTLPSYGSIFKQRKRRKLGNWVKQHTKNKIQVENNRQGINLIGYATYALGIGEDLRTSFHALKAQSIESKIIDFQPGGNYSARREFSIDEEIKESNQKAPFETTLLCLTAEETIRWALTNKDNTRTKTSYTIGYWPWELPNWPKSMLQALALVDEVWVSTEFIAQGLQGHTKKPIQVMPLCTETTECPTKPLNEQERKQARKIFNLPENSTLFCFSFDLSSYITRKNPWACIKAFHQAFPPALAKGDRDDVGLIIKTYPPKSANRDWEQLKEIAKLDSRIHLMETNLSRYQLLQLYGCCDGFLSMHRAEGFGRGMAEALQLGLDVVATDWSGNTDFCKGALAHPIAYELVPVHPGEYPHWPGQVWAEPNIKAAAEALQEIDRRRRKEGLPAVKLSTRYRQQFSATTCGARYRKRLEELGLINGI